MKKRIGSVLLALALCFTLLPTAAFAEGTSVDNWDGSADTSWYTSAPDASEYHISTAEQLAGLAQLVNTDPGTTNFAGKTFYLENDLDLFGHEWISIGTGRGGDYPEYSFCGVFDGKGHVISNLYSHESYIEGADESHNLLRNALFGNVYNGEVKNLGVANAEIWIDPKDDSAAGKGILVDWMGKSKIINCWTSGSIYSGTKIEKNIGGIVGVTVQGCTISGCYSTATLTGNFTNSEGYYKEPVPACDTIGGIVGARFDGDLTVTDCWFDGKIVVNSITAAVGGIVGYADVATVKNCMVTTTDMGVDKGGNTCWVAYDLDGTVEKCYWPNDKKEYDPSPLEDVTEGTVKSEDQGTAVSDFTSEDVLDGLQKNAGTGIKWVAGIKHPTFAWDDANIPADYTKVDEAIEKANALNENDYRDFSAVKAALNAVVRDKNITEQGEVDAMAKAIEDAINALVRRSSGGSSSSRPSYPITTPDKTENGSVTVTPKSAKQGNTVTITVTPDAGYVLDKLTVTDKDGKELSLTKKSDTEYTFVMPAGKVEITPNFVKQAEEPSRDFVDVKAGDYFYDAVRWAVEKGITNGTSAETFSPEAPCTRAQIVTFLWRAAGSPVVNYAMNLSDVAEDAYYAEAVRWALSEGITTGTSDHTFSPDATCTREQAVTFLYRAAGSPAVSGESAFEDVGADAYYARAVAWAAQNGVTNGISQTLFGSGNDCTRAQIVTFLYRAQQGK